jgi:serum/glucocorticoid-regulated kinase 2
MIAQSISSPYIVKLHYAFQTASKCYLIMDLMNGGDLFYHILQNGRLKERRVIKIAAQILLALKCLHENNIIYRDLKPMNVLLDKKDNVKLTDFGLSKMNYKEVSNVKQSL